MLSAYEAEKTTLIPTQPYPTLRADRAAVVESEPAPTLTVVACWTSAQAATMELSTIKPKDNRARGFTLPPTRKTSPYAITMIVKFLKMV